MATSRIQKFLDQTGVTTLWTRILEELDKKASQSEVNALKARIISLEQSLANMEIYGGSATDVIDEEEHE